SVIVQEIARRSFVLAVVIAVPLCIASVPAQTVSHAAAEEMSPAAFPSFIRDYAQTHHFNGSIKVEEDGQPLFSGSFGICDRAFNIRCADDIRYKIASITKAFTAVLVLQLTEEKKIDLEESINHYL